MPRTLRDVGRFETRIVLFQSSITATLATHVEKDVLEGRVRELNERISRLERRHDAETKVLAARCEGIERELAVFRETLKQIGQNGNETVPRTLPPQDPAVSRAFSGKDLEIMTKGVEALKKWTGKTKATIVYDSKKDPFTADGLFEKVRGRPNIALVGFTTDGDVFGGFYRMSITEQCWEFHDRNMFIFSFESHGRCMTPQRFDVKEGMGKRYSVVIFYKDDEYHGWFVKFDGYTGGFFLGNEKSDTYCINLSQGFEGIEDTTLTGKNRACGKGPYHHCARLIAVQLE